MRELGGVDLQPRVLALDSASWSYARKNMSNTGKKAVSGFCREAMSSRTPLRLLKLKLGSLRADQLLTLTHAVIEPAIVVGRELLGSKCERPDYQDLVAAWGQWTSRVPEPLVLLALAFAEHEDWPAAPAAAEVLRRLDADLPLRPAAIPADLTAKFEATSTAVGVAPSRNSGIGPASAGVDEQDTTEQGPAPPAGTGELSAISLSASVPQAQHVPASDPSDLRATVLALVSDQALLLDEFGVLHAEGGLFGRAAVAAMQQQAERTADLLDRVRVLAKDEDIAVTHTLEGAGTAGAVLDLLCRSDEALERRLEERRRLEAERSRAAEAQLIEDLQRQAGEAANELQDLGLVTGGDPAIAQRLRDLASVPHGTAEALQSWLDEDVPLLRLVLAHLQGAELPPEHWRPVSRLLGGAVFGPLFAGELSILMPAQQGEGPERPIADSSPTVTQPTDQASATQPTSTESNPSTDEQAPTATNRSAAEDGLHHVSPTRSDARPTGEEPSSVDGGLNRAQSAERPLLQEEVPGRASVEEPTSASRGSSVEQLPSPQQPEFSSADESTAALFKELQARPVHINSADLSRYLDRLRREFPVVELHEEALRQLGSAFSFAARHEPTRSWTAVVELHPKLQDLFGMSQGLRIFYIPYPELQLRTFEALLEVKIDRPHHRHVYGLWSRDPRLEAKLDQWTLTEPFAMVGLPRDGASEVVARQFLEGLIRQLSKHNPYIRTNPVTGADFFGRKALLRDLVEELRQGRVCGVFGLRKTGKTSLVTELGRQWTRDNAGSRAFVLRDLETLPSDPALQIQQLVSDISQQMARSFRDVGLRTHELSQLGETPSVGQWRQAVQAGLAHPTGKDKQVVVALDEIESLVGPDASSSTEKPGVAEFFGALRSLVQENPNFNVVISGITATPLKLATLYGRENPLFAWARPIFVSTLDEADAGDMVRALGSQMAVAWTDGALTSLLKQTGGHVYLTRSLAATACDALSVQLEVRTVTAGVVDGVTRTWRRNTVDVVNSMLDALERFYPAELAVLELGVSTGDFAALDDEYPSEMANLIQLGLIIEGPGGFSISPWLRVSNRFKERP